MSPAPSNFPRPGHAYGVDPRRQEYYSLRQARYDALADDIDAWAAKPPSGRKLKVIDVGCTTGLLFRHLEPRPHCSAIEISGDRPQTASRSIAPSATASVVSTI